MLPCLRPLSRPLALCARRRCAPPAAMWGASGPLNAPSAIGMLRMRIVAAPMSSRAALADEERILDMDEVEERMGRALEWLDGELGRVRSGRPDPAMFDHIAVEAYSAQVPLVQTAQVSIKSPTLAHVSCYDPTLVESVRAAIAAAGMELHPRVEDNGVVIVPLPKMSTEVRQQLAKLIKQHGESAKKTVRGVQKDGKRVLSKEKNDKDSSFSEDDIAARLKELEDLTKQYVAQIGEAVDSKTEQVLEHS